jgi:hypothetical protein
MKVSRKTLSMAVGNPKKTAIAFSLAIDPLAHVAGDVAGLLGNFVFDQLKMFFERESASRANVVIIELVTEVMEQVTNRDGALRVDVRIEGDTLEISVEGPAADEETIERARGGPGLVRLQAESKEKLSS